MAGEYQSLSIPSHQSLRAKIALGVALPILLVLSAFSVIHYLRERHLLESQIALSAHELGELALGSLRHAMEVNDPAMLASIMRDLNQIESVREVQIIGIDQQVKADSLGRNVRQTMALGDPGCVECHQSPPEDRPTTITLSESLGLLRVVRPIQNDAACQGCHAQQGAHLGVLLLDVSLVDLEQHLLDDLRVDLLFSGGITVLATLGIYLLIHRLVVRRIGAFRHPLAEFVHGNFGARVPTDLRPSDEIDALGDAFNRMADQMQRHARQEEERGQVRQRAIVEERERIARELHDGVAQLIGYVSTKAMAVRLMLMNQQHDAAQKHLAQLEEAAQKVFVDVREAILGLKMAGRNGGGLPAALREYTAQYSRLSGIPVELSIALEVEGLSMPAETELHVARIVQEALANVRKHASAQRVSVSLGCVSGQFELIVRDDGIGFDPLQARDNGRSHFGLGTMRERAEAIGADFTLHSEPGAGACVCVRMKINTPSP